MFGITRIDGFDEVLISKHRTEEAANKAFDKKYKRDTILSPSRFRVRDLDKYEVVNIFGKNILRPRV